MEAYIQINNQEGKEWIFPKRNAKTALEIYQPSSWKGRTVKKLLPALLKIGLAPFCHKVTELDQRIPVHIQQVISESFPNEDIQISYFGGSPGTHKKPTIQVFSGNRLLGYAKYTRNPQIIRLFQNEEHILRFLKISGVEQVPNCLRGEIMEDGTVVFIQDTEKKTGAKTWHQYRPEHRKFLEKLYEKTSIKIPFTDTEFAEMLIDVQKRTYLLTESEQSLVNQIAKNIYNQYAAVGMVSFGVCHRDFTPWNTCVSNQELYVFDWEYARRTYPAGLDCARFFVEIYSRERHMQDYDIIQVYLKSGQDLLALVAYLVDNIDLYLNRGNEEDIQIARRSVQLLYVLIKYFGCDWINKEMRMEYESL